MKALFLKWFDDGDPKNETETSPRRQTYLSEYRKVNGKLYNIF